MDEVGPRPPSARNFFEILPVDESCLEDLVQEEMVEYDNGSVVCAEPALGLALSSAAAGDNSPILVSARPSKRMRSDLSESSGKEFDQEEYTLVRNKSARHTRKSNMMRVANQLSVMNGFEVCVSSYELLPKQIGLAKLFKAENINNIKQIKYKSPYKLYILFENKEDAEDLMRNKRLLTLGLRFNLTSEVGITYGVVRNLEMDITEEELFESFKCEHDIIAVKRLKRASDNGEWVMSETVRFAFKGPKLPEYICGYGCRFKVDPFTFPVTQCSVCWNFGHLTRTCPTKKVCCPKCGKGHANCEVTKFRCLNCKGGHMAFDKSCPVYIKERDIRAIMSKDNCTYKNALSKYIECTTIKRSNDKPFNFGNQSKAYDFARPGMSYSQSIGAKVTQSEVYNLEPQEGSDIMEESDDDAKEDSGEEKVVMKNTVGKKKRKNKNRKNKDKASDVESERTTENKNQSDSADDGKNYFSRIFRKAKEIICATECLEGKVRMVLQFILEEVMSFIVKTMSNGETLSKLVGLFHDG